ncbi:UDP-N-acetylmuramoyl-tripeptide--D-alanyl-D-alanine ligase [Enteractinococcus coprophilus]|uniref:UDP-N-acetylmuramoyl-tripeptide--D-alanyl-D-alanine ligase n=1 Tax=Enteractinococcus coprophilus TaxID=1027633 RepID=A0A543AJS6_9MICC|nr:UDP-N-acetylmuramoyl-tripeptide--D-alanyl-D-alanine ligase [Enteractinococcus coprophilus]TQL72843.1 UDP-N-acetylmuramoyl-tripeptide--D-alanyl-D-alanine ligase [Enteractinococcus coprophilus]
MIELNANQIAEATGGRLTATVDPNSVVTSANTDSREMNPGALFIARRGQTTDGHNFITAARQAGATLILAERETQDGLGAIDPAVIVEDSTQAMGHLARYIVDKIREHSETTVIAITGSVGKTSTKDALAAMLATQGPTTAPQGSYNGEVGVPLTIFTAALDTRYLVVEMGADRIGNITELTDIVRPDISVVLTVGTAHAASFGSVDNIAQTKGEIVEALPAGGIAVLNADDIRVAEMAERVPDQASTLWFSAAYAPPQRERLVYAADAATTKNENPHFTLQYFGSDADEADRTGYDVTAQLIGEHHTTNLLAAATAAFAADIPLDTIASLIPTITATSAHRMARTDRPDGITILDDAYNANPESMRAGLKTLAMLGRNTGRRTWAVLGPMLELGDAHAKEHILLGEVVVRLNIDQLVVVGSTARALYTGAVNEGSWGDEVDYVLSNDEALELLAQHVEPGDIIFVKGSNGTRLWELADQLTTAQLVAHKEKRK